MAMTEPAIFTEFKAKVLERGVCSIKGLGRTFRMYDEDGSKGLNLKEFCKGIKDCGVDFSDDKAKELFTLFDKDGSGSISFDEILIKLRGNLSVDRKGIVLQAFKKADRSGNGTIGVEDMKEVYNTREHPKYKNGEWTESQVFKSFLETFEPDETKRDKVVTEEEFLNYYAGVSASVDDDAYFELMIKNAWKI